MLATIIGILTIFILLGLVVVPFAALRDAKRNRRREQATVRQPGTTAPNKPAPDPPHPLAWLLYLLIALLFAGIGAWHIAHPDELMGGGKWLTVAMGLAYLALGKYGPGIVALAVATGFFAAFIQRLRAQD